MATTMPVSLYFQLPDGWVSGDPDQAGAPGSAFIAGHPGSAEGDFLANILIRGELRPDRASLAQIANEPITQTRQDDAFSGVHLVERREVGGSDSPGLVQVMKVVFGRDDGARRLIQTQAFMSMFDVDDLGKRAVVTIQLTATPSQFATVIPDFEIFLRSIRPAASEGASH